MLAYCLRSRGTMVVSDVRPGAAVVVWRGAWAQGKYVAVGQPSVEELKSLTNLCPRMFKWLVHTHRPLSDIQASPARCTDAWSTAATQTLLVRRGI